MFAVYVWRWQMTHVMSELNVMNIADDFSFSRGETKIKCERTDRRVKLIQQKCNSLRRGERECKEIASFSVFSIDNFAHVTTMFVHYHSNEVCRKTLRTPHKIYACLALVSMWQMMAFHLKPKKELFYCITTSTIHVHPH